MQLVVGEIYEGKVTGITKFGAFVSFEDGQTGMVHISEVAATFVNEIREFVTEGQSVKVRVLNITDDGKVSLSMKKAVDMSQKSEMPRRGPRNNPGQRQNSGGGGNFKLRARRPDPQPSPARPGDFEWQQKSNDGGNFEDMMSRFKQTSDEKISDLKRGTETRRGYSRRGK
jgi:Predicted RNA binding protein (contains ribosomal protein S1 domain)